MFAIKITIFLVYLTVSVKAHDHYEHIKKEMDKDDIVPSILPDYPHHHLTITYPNNKTVHLGNELTPTEVKDEPTVNWESDSKKYYTLIMFDPDAPSRQEPTLADVKHWLIGNILGDNLPTGDVIAEYFGSGPPKNTGFHRYIFLVYQQKNRITFDEPRSLKLSRANRLKWSLKDFVKRYDLGDAFAGDYFKAQWDQYVDERNKVVTNH